MDQNRLAELRKELGNALPSEVGNYLEEVFLVLRMRDERKK